MAKLLVIDDDPTVLHLFRRRFEYADFEVETADSAARALAVLATHPIDVVVLDVLLPDMSGLEVFRQVRLRDAKVPVIFITTQTTSETAIQAMQLGAYDYLLKPLDFARIPDILTQAFALRRLMNEPVGLSGSGEQPAGDMLVGRCPSMQEVYKAIGRVASQNVTVLVRGVSGTGKELVARAIYHHSHRAEGPYRVVNCAAIPEPLLESELFGHEKGAFTGADRRRIGRFEQCSGGTLFLDEIGDMTPLLQAKVLRVLQEQRFERVGGDQPIETDARIIAATNRDLENMVAAGTFRADLYYRLDGYTIRLPPLRDRAQDLDMLIQHFLGRLNRELKKDVLGLADDALEWMRGFSWPGNVRELQNVMRRAMLRATGTVITAKELPDYMAPSTRVAGFSSLGADPFPLGQLPSNTIPSANSPSALNTSSTASPAPAHGHRDDHEAHTLDLDHLIQAQLHAGSTQVYDAVMAQVERHLIARVLRFTDGNQNQTAKVLGIARGTLRAKIRVLGISIERRVVADEDDEE